MIDEAQKALEEAEALKKVFPPSSLKLWPLHVSTCDNLV